MTTRKGAGVNNMSSAGHALVLATLDYADSFHTSWGDWCWLSSKMPNWSTNPQVNPDWVFALGYTIPNAADVAAAVANNPYHRNLWWGCGVEPNANTNPATGQPWTALEFANLVTAQINAVKDIETGAKFWLRCGTQEAVNTNYMRDVFANLSSSKRNNWVKAVGYHIYPQNTAPWTYAAEPGKLDTPILNQLLEDAIAKRDEINTLYGLDLQFWIGETGLTINTDPQSIYKETNSLMQSWPHRLHAACDTEGVDRFFVYGWQDIPNYMNVYHGTTRTAFGTALDDSEPI